MITVKPCEAVNLIQVKDYGIIVSWIRLGT